MSDFRIEFPDFDPATLPAIPSDWKDVSWCNDACPSFEVDENHTVYIDYADTTLREIPDWKRFFIQKYSEDGSAVCVMMSDDFQMVLDYFS